MLESVLRRKETRRHGSTQRGGERRFLTIVLPNGVMRQMFAVILPRRPLQTMASRHTAEEVP